MGKRRVLTLVKAISFILIFCLVLNCASSVLVNPDTEMGLRHYQYIRGFFEESKDSLDVIFVGASNVYTSWIPSVSWKKYGLKTRNMASASLGGDYIKPLIQNIYSLHPDALYIVALNSFLWETEEFAKHDLIDYFPIKEKMEFVFTCTREGKISLPDMVQYLFPLTRFHRRWNQLKREDFHYKLNGLKGDSVFPSFLTGVVDVTDTFENTCCRKEIDDRTAKTLKDFLAYCEKSDIQILFIGMPWARSAEIKAQVNYMADIASRNGFNVINLLNYLAEIDLNPKSDYINIGHTNIHGALKVTDYLSQYLLEHYDFPENTCTADESWDEAYDKYKEIITPYLSEEELRQLP